MADEFCQKMPDFHVTFRDLLHAANLRHGTDGFTSPPKGRRAEEFFTLKNTTASVRFEPANLCIKGSTLPLEYLCVYMINIEAELCKSVTVYRFASLLLLTSSSIFARNVGALRRVVTELILERSLCTVSCVNKHDEHISQF